MAGRADTPGDTGPSPARVAALLRERRVALIAEWARRVVNDPRVPEATRLAYPELRDHIPDLLDRLLDALDRAAPAPATSEQAAHKAGEAVGQGRAAQSHARSRFAHRYSMPAAMRELSHLRAVILDLCAEAGVPLAGRAAQLVHSAIDESMVTMLARLPEPDVESRAFRRALRRALLAPMLLALALVGLLTVQIVNLRAATRWLDHTDRVIATANHDYRLLVDAETGLRGYLLTSDRVFLEPYDRARGELPTALEALARLVGDNPAQVRRVEELRREYDAWNAQAAARVVAYGVASPAEVYASALEGKRRMDAMRATMARLVDLEGRLRVARALRTERVAWFVHGLVAALVIALGVVLGLFSRRELTAVGRSYSEALSESRARAHALDESHVFAREVAEALRVEAEFRERFIGVLSHDLRTPVSAIVFTAATLRARQDLPEWAARGLQRIASSAGRIERMIRDLLEVTRVRTGGEIPLAPEPADLAMICRSVTDELLAASEGRAVELDARGDTRGVWDTDRLTQAAQNLISNALEHGAPAAPVRVAIDGEAPARVTLAVSNQGPAIAPDELSAIFEPFRRGTSRGPSRAGTSGLGLGLYITREIVRAHGGEVRVASTAAEGTTFTIELPRVAGQGASVE